MSRASERPRPVSSPSDKGAVAAERIISIIRGGRRTSEYDGYGCATSSSGMTKSLASKSDS